MIKEMTFDDFKKIMQNLKHFNEHIDDAKRAGIDLSNVVDNVYWVIETYESLLFEPTDLDWLYNNFVHGNASIDEAWEYVINGCINVIEGTDE